MKTKLLTVMTTVTLLTSVLSTTKIAQASSFTCNVVDGIDNDATRTCSTSFALDWTDIIDETLFLPQFKSSWGTLNSATLIYDGQIEGDAAFENRSARTSTITVNLAGLLTLKDSDGNTLFELTPHDSSSYSVARSDGALDYSGTSGKTLEGLNAQQTGQTTFTGSDLTPYIGGGTINYSFSAVANSSVIGSGNINSYINTKAGSSLKIAYNYTRKIPEPSTTLALGLLAGFGLLSQRKRVFTKA